MLAVADKIACLAKKIKNKKFNLEKNLAGGICT